MKKTLVSVILIFILAACGEGKPMNSKNVVVSGLTPRCYPDSNIGILYEIFQPSIVADQQTLSIRMTEQEYEYFCGE